MNRCTKVFLNGILILTELTMPLKNAHQGGSFFYHFLELDRNSKQIIKKATIPKIIKFLTLGKSKISIRNI